MKGIPKYLNTKQDYVNIVNLFPEEQWKPFYQELLDTRFIWSVVGNLEEGDEGVTDSTHKIGMDSQDGEKVRVQLELIEDSNARIFQLGFTVQEVQQMITPS